MRDQHPNAWSHHPGGPPNSRPRLDARASESTHEHPTAAGRPNTNCTGRRPLLVLRTRFGSGDARGRVAHRSSGCRR